MNNKNDLKAEKTLCNCTFVYIEVIRVDNVPEVVEELNDQLIMKKKCTSCTLHRWHGIDQIEFRALAPGGKEGGSCTAAVHQVILEQHPPPI